MNQCYVRKLEVLNLATYREAEEETALVSFLCVCTVWKAVCTLWKIIFGGFNMLISVCTSRMTHLRLLLSRRLIFGCSPELDS